MASDWSEGSTAELFAALRPVLYALVDLHALGDMPEEAFPPHVALTARFAFLTIVPCAN